MNRKARTFSWYEAALMLGTTQAALIAMMRNRNEMQHGSPPLPNENLIRAGLFVVEPGTILINNQIPKSYRTARVTIQGLAWLETQLRPAAA